LRKNLFSILHFSPGGGRLKRPPQIGEGSQDLIRQSKEKRFAISRKDPSSFWGGWPAQPVGWGLSFTLGYSAHVRAVFKKTAEICPAQANFSFCGNV